MSQSQSDSRTPGHTIIIRPKPAAPSPSSTELVFRSYAQSKSPILALTSLFGATSVLPDALFRRPNGPYVPPQIYRSGFAMIFGYATYMFWCGDARNGAGFTTSTTLIYLFLNMRKSLKSPRHPLSLALTGGAAACAALYGTEYYYFLE